ncbi:myelin protein zero-like protein 2b [Thalassophryne amazonica]|uniref:myelin protein zero-like protein 2b n=1 Tax=Thalassophryne amazonica TaxID=390379 RepID=UPI0014713302|nr:myelin protein zero-like protein 2b [Thalassophryne amazonica]
MCCSVSGIWPLLVFLLGGFIVPGVRHVSGIDISTQNEVQAVNGTNVKLECTFSSSHPLSQETVTVSWSFRPLNGGPEESVFFYQEEPFLPLSGLFKGHAMWSGDIMKGDASITLCEVLPTFNGTYICQVRNRPDVHGINGETTLTVVNKVSLSEISILAIAVGSACVAILIILAVIVVVRRMRKRCVPAEFDMHPQEWEWKDPTVCKPEEAVHLKGVTLEKEADSSDDEESEPSSGDDDEEEEGGGG